VTTGARRRAEAAATCQRRGSRTLEQVLDDLRRGIDGVRRRYGRRGAYQQPLGVRRPDRGAVIEVACEAC
jgi:hypothetical protein